MNEEQDKRIAWIDTVAQESAKGELKAVYDANTDRQHGCVDHILQIHSLHPKSLLDHLRLYQTLMFGRSPISRPQREMIAVVVSAINNCVY